MKRDVSQYNLAEISLKFLKSVIAPNSTQTKIKDLYIFPISVLEIE